MADFDPKAWKELIEEAMPRPFGQPGRADLLVRSVLALKPELWHTDDGEAFASIVETEGGPQQHYRIASDEFTAVMLRAYEAVDPIWMDGPDGGLLQMPAHTKSTIESAKTVLKAMGAAGPTKATAVRVAAFEGDIWYDLGDASRQVVRITRKGWKIEDRCPVAFLRPPGMLPAARPQRHSGSVARDVAQLFNLDGEQFQMLVCFCLDALRPWGHHMVATVRGPSGSGKTTFTKFIRDTIDPHTARLEAFPGVELNLARQADSCWLLAYDNLSQLTAEQQDWLCRLSTGYVFRVKRHYSDRELSSFTWCGPVLLTSTRNLIGRSDLATRNSEMRVSAVADGYRPDTVIERLAQALRGRFLGYLFDGVVKALAATGRTPQTGLPRLAASAHWCAAAAPAFGWTGDDVVAQFRAQEAAALRQAAASDPVAAQIHAWMTVDGLWRWPAPDMTMADRAGSVGELHTLLTSRSALYARDWPKLASEFAAALHDAEPTLAACGIEIAWQPNGLQLVLTRGLTVNSTVD